MAVYDFGLRLKELRHKNGYTQKQVADFLKVQVNSISRYENNTQLPPVDKLKELAVFYRSSSDYILGLDDRQNLYIDDLPKHLRFMIMDILKRVREEYV